MNKRIAALVLLFSLLLSGCVSKEAESTAPEAEPEPTAAEPTAEPAGAAPVLSEVMSRNHTTPIEGRLCDWVELYNPNGESVNLGNYAIGKDESAEKATPLTGELGAGEYWLLTETELGFRLSKDGESLYLFSSDGTAVDSMSIPALQGNESYVREQGVVDTPTPGKENRAENVGGSCVPSALRISEACTANESIVAYHRDYYDWVELYNSGSSELKLSDYYLSDDHDELKLWQLPDEVLLPQTYTVLYFTDARPFSLSAAGETLYLSNGDGLIADILTIPAIPADCSFGREKGVELYYASPSPGKANFGGYEAMCAAPEVSEPSGWYDAPFSVFLSGEGEIRYTTDGSCPNESSALYGGEQISVEQSMSLRFRAYDGNRIPSGIVTVNYFLDALPLTLDVVKISVSPQDVYAKLHQYSVDKAEASIALYVDGVEQFSESCAVSIQGSGSRIYEKLSYQIDFRSRYGKAELDYPLFDKLEQTKFTTIALRSGSQDQCSACMRDELISDIFYDCSPNLLTFCYRPVSLYLNEQYRGVYYIRERCKTSTIAYRYDVDKDDAAIIRNMDRLNMDYDYNVDFYDLTRYMYSHNFSHQEQFEEFCTMIDIDSLTDYLIAIMWNTNYDTNNIRFFRTGDGEPWKLILYDSDVAFFEYYGGWVRTTFRLYGGLLNNLMRNEGYKEKFTRRLGELLRGPLAEDAVIARIDALEAQIDNDMQYNCKLYPAVTDYDKWKSAVEDLRSRQGYGVRDWNYQLIRQYLELVQLDDALIAEAFGEEFVR